MTIKFNKNFYSLKAVERGIRVYKGLADFNFKEKRVFIEVTLKNIDKDFKDIIGNEFCNYVLAEMKNVYQSQ